MSRYFLHFAYNGKNYHGWQIQDNAPTIQAVLHKNLSLFFRTEIELCGAGRTDTGVHAKDYYAHFDLDTPLNKEEIPLLVHKLNGFLNEDIVIFNILAVKENAHARFDAISRTYNYYVSLKKDIFNFDYCYSIYGSLNVELMNQAAAVLLDYNDFSSFSKSNTQTKTNNCKINAAYWQQEEDKLIFSITADRFLRNMVRAIVGTLLEVGFEKITLDEFRQIIESKNRSEAGWSVPAKALFLTEIKYPDNIFKI